MSTALETADIRLGMRHQLRSVWRTSRGFAIGAVVFSVVLHGLAIVVAAMHSRVPETGVTVEQMMPLAAGLWAALALLPALGGGESDDPTALAAARAGRSFRFGARLASSLTDAGPGLFIPAIALVGAAAAGWAGWIAGLVLAVNGLACGQLSGASSAALVARVGATGALIVVAILVLLAATVLGATGLGPGSWWRSATEQRLYLIPLVVTAILALFGAWALNRPAERAVGGSHRVPIPSNDFAAVFVAVVTGCSRSLMARSMIITAVLTPLLVRAGGQEVTTSIAFFVTAAVAAVFGANGFAYDGGANVWLLSKTGRWNMVVARLLTTTIWALSLSVVAAASAALVGAAPPLDLLPQFVLVSVAAAACGLAPAAKRPTPTDFDSFRAQPAPVPSAMGTLARSVVLTLAILVVPLPAAVLITAAYVAFACGHARWYLRDPVALAALT